MMIYRFAFALYGEPATRADRPDKTNGQQPGNATRQFQGRLTTRPVKHSGANLMRAVCARGLRMSARPVTVEYKGISQINDIQLLIHNTLPPPENLSEGAYPWPVEDNSLTSDIISGTSEWISRNDANRFLGVAVIRGGPTVFCQGEKLELETNGVSSVMIEYYKRVYNLIHKLSSVSTPLLTLMQGRTSFSGLGFGCAAQHSVTTDETVVSMPSVAFGLVPSGGSTYHLSRLRGSLGLFVALGAGEIVGPHC